MLTIAKYHPLEGIIFVINYHGSYCQTCNSFLIKKYPFTYDVLCDYIVSNRSILNARHYSYLSFPVSKLDDSDALSDLLYLLDEEWHHLYFDTDMSE